MRLTRFSPLAALASVIAVCALPRTVQAAEDRPELEANGLKGAVGGALLGAEVVMLVEAALDVEPAWAYIVGGVAGAAAGGVGGYFWENSSDSPKLGMYLLTAGMALAIPTTVAVLSATAYEPPADYVEDRPPSPDEPIAEPPQPEMEPPPASDTLTSPPEPEGRRPLRRAPRYSRSRPAPALYPVAPPALVGITPQALTLSVPAVEIRDLFTPEERHLFGVAQGTELRVPVMNFAF
jgi:hypothetical protein